MNRDSKVHQFGPPTNLPKVAVELARRLGGEPDCASGIAELRQTGELRTKETAKWMRFSATQTIQLHAPGFSWLARVGPLGMIRVIDELEGTRPKGSVSLFGLWPIATAKPSPALLKGQLMRYLAELPWSPDAILANNQLEWTEVDRNKLTVAAEINDVRGLVKFTLDKEGRVAQVEAGDRPRQEGTAMVERPWRGTFRNYREVGGRIVPLAAEAGWILEGAYCPVWKGEVALWRLGTTI